MAEAKTISYADYLTGLALFTMACDHQREAVRFEKAMNKVLDLGAPDYDSSRVSDAIYHYGGEESFDQAIAYAGITVEPEQK